MCRQSAGSLDSTGFLRDPSDELGAIENPDLLELTDMLLVSVLVVLGEPGMGKSSLLQPIEGLTRSEDRTPITIDLAHSNSVERLDRRLTITPTVAD